MLRTKNALMIEVLCEACDPFASSVIFLVYSACLEFCLALNKQCGCRSFSFWAFNSINFYAFEGRRRSKSDGSDSNEENLSKKELALRQALDQITTSFGKGSIMWLGRSVSSKHVPVVSTGSFALDIVLGIGGLPKVCSNVWISSDCFSVMRLILL